MKEKRIEKEIKKAQKKGIYNPKLKLGIVALILVIGTVIGVSYAYYTGTANNTLTISGTVSKRINIRVEAGEHGAVESMDIATKQTDYGTSAKFKLTPAEGYQYKEVTCTDSNKVTPIYDRSNNTLTITPKTINNVSCTVIFTKVVKLVDEIKKANTIRIATPGENLVWNGLYKRTTNNKNSYYFRGAAENNYVKFGLGTTIDSPNHPTDLIWRIVEINEDENILLVLNTLLNDKIYYENGDFIDSIEHNALNDWYNKYLYDSKNIIKKNYIYNSSSSKTDLEDFYTINTINSYIGLLTINEVMDAGLLEKNMQSYLQLKNSNPWWTMSCYRGTYVDPDIGVIDTYYKYYISKNDYAMYDWNSAFAYLRPVIVLNSNVYAYGSGIKDNPYVIF